MRGALVWAAITTKVEDVRGKSLTIDRIARREVRKAKLDDNGSRSRRVQLPSYPRCRDGTVKLRPCTHHKPQSLEDEVEGGYDDSESIAV